MGDEAEALITRFADYVGDSEFFKEVEDFVQEASSAMKLGDEDTVEAVEHSHDHYGLYQEYCGLMEAKIQEFLDHEGIDQEEFYALLKDAQSNNEGVDFFVQFLIASTEYDAFVDMVRWSKMS